MKLTRVLFKKSIISELLKTEQELSIPTPWGKLSALTWGNSSKPPILLCHGQLDCCSSFRPLISHLPQDYFYVSVDLPGSGKSDKLPRGVVFSVMDVVPSLRKVQEHFKWDKFTFMGHSFGCHVGLYYMAAYPGRVNRAIYLDPILPPLKLHDDLRKWYLHYYVHFYENYDKLNGDESAPTYRYEEIREKIKKARRLTDEAVDHIVERCTEPVGDGLYRLTFDQRQKYVMFPPDTNQLYQRVWTSTNIPMLSITASQSIPEQYNTNSYMLDDKCWPNKNYKLIHLDGVHDNHVNKPEELVEYIKEFLEEQDLNLDIPEIDLK